MIQKSIVTSNRLWFLRGNDGAGHNIVERLFPGKRLTDFSRTEDRRPIP